MSRTPTETKQVYLPRASPKRGRTPTETKQVYLPRAHPQNSNTNRNKAGSPPKERLTKA